MTPGFVASQSFFTTGFSPLGLMLQVSKSDLVLGGP